MSNWWDRWEVNIGPVQDGTAAMAHDGFDLDTWQDMREMAGRLDRSMDPYLAQFPTMPDLMRDSFISLFRHKPEVNPPAPLLPSHQPHQAIMQALTQNQDWVRLHSETHGDALTSTMGCIAMAPSLFNSLDEKTKEWMQRQAEAERKVQQLRNGAETLRDMSNQPGADKGGLEEAAQDWEHQADEIAQQAGNDPAPDSQVNMGAISHAVAQAEQAGESAQAAANLLGGKGIGSELGRAGHGMDIQEKMRLAGKLLANNNLQDIARMAGRMARVARAIHDPRVIKSPEVFKEVATGDDVRRLTGSELARMADPDTEDLFWTRYADKSLAIKLLEGTDLAGRGPLIIALDSSGSMGGVNETWSKAAAFVMLAIAKEEKRDVKILHFASRGDFREDEFLAGEGSVEKVTESLDFFISGGTDYDEWMERSLEIVDEARWDKADVVLISDGFAHVSDELRASWDERRKERGMRCLGILLTQGEQGHWAEQAATVFDQVTDHLVMLDTNNGLDVGNSMAALERIFTL